MNLKNRRLPWSKGASEPREESLYLFPTLPMFCFPLSSKTNHRNLAFCAPRNILETRTSFTPSRSSCLETNHLLVLCLFVLELTIKKFSNVLCLLNHKTHTRHRRGMSSGGGPLPAAVMHS